MGLKQKVYCYILDLLKKQQIKIIGIGGFLAIFGIFTLSFALFRSRTPARQYVNKAVSICLFGGLSIDSKGNIYIGDQDNGLVQVFNEKEEYLYGFYAGTSAWHVFDIDSQDKLHIGSGKGHSHKVFLGGELVSSKDLNYEQEKELEKSYRSSRSKVFKTDNKIYKYSFLNKIVVRDLNNNAKNTITLPIPLWPWPIHVNFMIYIFGVVLFCSGTMGINKLEEMIKN